MPIPSCLLAGYDGIGFLNRHGTGPGHRWLRRIVSTAIAERLGPGAA